MFKRVLTNQPEVLVGEFKTICASLEKEKKYIVSISEARSLDLNDCFHGWCRFLATELGFEFDEIKYYFLIKNGHYSYGRTSLNKDKRRIKIAKSSSELTKSEFMSMLMSMEVFASERGIQLPESEHKTKTLLNIKF